MTLSADEIAKILARGDLVVMRSDTVYGIFASALDKRAVEKLHSVRERDQKSGFIVLVDSVKTVVRLVRLSDEILKRLTVIWRGDSPTSVILPAEGLKETWLADTRESKPRICFRVPTDKKLQQLLVKTGPLCAPSANLPDEPPACNIAEAKEYFGDAVSLYIDGGGCDNAVPSRIITFENNRVKVIRPDGRNHPEDFIITRRRKLYKFAHFDEYPTCFQFDEWKTFLARNAPAKENHSLQGRFLQKGREIVVEIGAGSALFSVELARRHPKKLFIAVDIKSDRLYQGACAAAKLDLENIYFIRADIAQITEIIPPHSASEIWLTFPDPWPPKSDARHRLTAPRYLKLYREILARNVPAKIHFKTDNLSLFEWSLEQFTANGWKIEFITRDLHNSDAPDDAKITTSYEQKFIAQRLKINYARFH